MVPNEHQLYGGAKLPKINLGFISSTQFSTYQRAEVNERGTFGSTLESPYSVTFEVWRWYEVCKILSGENELFNISTLDDIWLASISVWLVSTKADWDQNWLNFFIVQLKMKTVLKMYSTSGHQRCRWVCFFIRTDLEKFSIPSLAHQWILWSEWVPSEWESKQLIKTSQLSTCNPHHSST